MIPRVHAPREVQRAAYARLAKELLQLQGTEAWDELHSDERIAVEAWVRATDSLAAITERRAALTRPICVGAVRGGAWGIDYGATTDDVETAWIKRRGYTTRLVLAPTAQECALRWWGVLP